MTKQEFEKAIKNDPYLKTRSFVSEGEKRILLREVNFRCPLCKKDLQVFGKMECSHFEIAHIYPNKPTIHQYETLLGAERMGDTCESIDNKIALCLDCHNNYDYKTTLNEYLHLLSIKKNIKNTANLRESIENLSLDDEIFELINRITLIEGKQLKELNYSPVPIKNKIESKNEMLKTKIESYVEKYYTFIRDCLRELDGKNGFQSDVISCEIKACYLKLKGETDQNLVFELIVDWMMKETKTIRREACEVLVSYFVQNCEVFDEISE